MSAQRAASPTAVLERLVEISSDGMLAFDREGRYVAWNPAMEAISGLRADQVLGKVAFELFPFLHETGEDELIRQALAGRTVRSENRPFHVESSGRSGYFQAEYAPLRSAEGELIGAVGVVRDLTATRVAEQQARETESRFRIMADAAPVLLWMSRSDGLCTFFNQTWLDFTGRTLAEEWGVGWAEGVHFEDFQHCMDTYTEAFNRRQRFEMVYRLRRKDGEYRWLLDRGAPRYTPDGTFAGFIGSCVDISEHKQLEVVLRRSVRARDEFLSVASHELRTPITALQLQLEMLLRALDRAAGAALDVDTLHKRAARALDKTLYLGDMVNVLLDASRIAEGRLDLEYSEIDLDALVREALERHRETATAAGCALEYLAEARPVVRCDAFRITQVVTNLLSNALKYGAGGPVRVGLRQSQGVARLEVADDGPGVPAEHQSAIFERFARVVPSKNYGGFGLGLWIARQVVLAHGGRIDLREGSVKGAAFVVELPLAPAMSVAPAQGVEDVRSTERV